MNKKLVLVLIVISIFATFATMAAAPLGPKTVNLVGTYYSGSKLIVKFHVTGFTKRTDIRASITVDKHIYPLFCKYDDVDQLICIAPHVNRYAGLPARIWVSGFVFYSQVPFK